MLKDHAHCISRSNHPISIHRYTDVSGIRKRCTLCQRNQRSDHAVCHCDHAFYGAVVFLYLTVYFRFFTASPFFTPNTSIPIRTGAQSIGCTSHRRVSKCRAGHRWQSCHTSHHKTKGYSMVEIGSSFSLMIFQVLTFLWDI